MNKFDLMKEKPELDINTLNYIWDWLWRSNAINDQNNVEKRAIYKRQKELMCTLENLADERKYKQSYETRCEDFTNRMEATK